MNFEIEIIRFLQKLSNLFWDNFFITISFFGNYIFFIIIFVFFYTCLNRKFSIQLLYSYSIACVFNSILKLVVKRIRPYKAHSDIIKSIGIDEKGYSFPSGHTTSITNLGISTTKFYKKKYFIIITTFVVFLVMLSRMYLGQHYFFDVFFGLIISSIITYLTYILIDKLDDNLFEILYICIFSILLLIMLFKHNYNNISFLLSSIFICLANKIENKKINYQLNNLKFSNKLIRLFFSLIIVSIFIIIYNLFVSYKLIYLAMFTYPIMMFILIIFCSFLFKKINI